MKVVSRVVFVAALWAATPVFADVEIETEMLRNYRLLGTFSLNGAQFHAGPNGTTLISNTVGVDPEASACGVIFVTDEGAVLHAYRYNDVATACVSTLPHPTDGVFLRVVDPTAEVGIVSGATVYLNSAGEEQWAVPDQRLVDASPEPTGPGAFQGVYQQPDRVLAYSERSDRLMAFTIGLLDLGLDQKLITQAHVINVDSGAFTVSGQTFGQAGVGTTGGAEVRDADGDFLLYYFVNETEGATFFEYDGRSSISSLRPRGENWEDRFVPRMIFARDSLHLLWSDSAEVGTETRLTTTTGDGAELWSAVFDPEYTFADGQMFLFGPPSTMWVGAEQTAILHQIEQMSFLRLVDTNGDSDGMARLDVTDFPPAGIVTSPEGTFRLMTFDSATRTIFEHEMTFIDVDPFDPENPPLPADVSIPDVGLGEVLEAVGCCATSSTRTPWGLVLFAAILVVLRRRHARP